MGKGNLSAAGVVGEHGEIRARAEVPLAAQYQKFYISGIADGVMGKTVGSRVVAPFLVILEAKRGIEGSDSVPQLYGEMLAAARLNWQLQPDTEPQKIFGCYTIADTWTFLHVKSLILVAIGQSCRSSIPVNTPKNTIPALF